MKPTEMTSKSKNPTVPSITAENKAIKWKQLPEGLYCVYFEGGGELPRELSGTWTSINKVKAAIDTYKAKRGY